MCARVNQDAKEKPVAKRHGRWIGDKKLGSKYECALCLFFSGFVKGLLLCPSPEIFFIGKACPIINAFDLQIGLADSGD